jgi:hypothetical protein
LQQALGKLASERPLPRRFPLMSSPWIFRLAIAVLAGALLSGCYSAPDQAPAIGEAYAGPATLKLRKEIDPKSPVSAVVPHGARLEITAQRRRWYKVRTKKGEEGWTEDRELLDTGQMSRLKSLAQETAGLPSQGSATTFDTLNIHTEPNRLSASFLQVKEGEKFDVIAHRVLARESLPRRELVAPKPKAQPAKKGKKTAVPQPPEPQPPPLPKDWVALSKERARIPEDDTTPAAKDDWTLIRTRDGESGWVLTGRVYMAIPDEVAQYAEGNRITSWFSLGKVRDGGLEKDIWLWTTSSELGEDHDFDGYRVFTWSMKRHRYETAFIQRRERGYFPVLAKQGVFSVCLESHDGTSRIGKQFELQGNAVRLIGTRPCAKSPEESGVTQDDNVAHIEIHEAPAKPGMFERLTKSLKSLVGK